MFVYLIPRVEKAATGERSEFDSASYISISKTNCTYAGWILGKVHTPIIKGFGGLVTHVFHGQRGATWGCQKWLSRSAQSWKTTEMKAPTIPTIDFWNWWTKAWKSLMIWSSVFLVVVGLVKAGHIYNVHLNTSINQTSQRRHLAKIDIMTSCMAHLLCSLQLTSIPPPSPHTSLNEVNEGSGQSLASSLGLVLCLYER